MILIQVILIVSFLYFLFRFLSNPNSSKMQAWKKILGVLFALLAIIVVLFPNISNDIAHIVGVGRGADLLLYLLTVSFIISNLNLYIKSKQDQRTTVELARKIAILEANMKSRRPRHK